MLEGYNLHNKYQGGNGYRSKIRAQTICIFQLGELFKLQVWPNECCNQFLLTNMKSQVYQEGNNNLSRKKKKAIIIIKEEMVINVETVDAISSLQVFKESNLQANFWPK